MAPRVAMGACAGGVKDVAAEEGHRRTVRGSWSGEGRCTRVSKLPGIEDGGGIIVYMELR